MRPLLFALVILLLAPSAAAGQVFTTPMGGERNTDFAEGVVVLPDRRIVAAGTVDWDLGPVAIGLVRYLPSGELDPSFGDGGRVVTRGEVLSGRALARQPDGKLLVGGTACEGATCDMLVARYTPDGALDGSFGSGGIARVRFGACGDDPPRAGALDLALEPGGAIVAAGAACTGESYSDAAAIRLGADGSLDGSFGDGGRASIELGDFGSEAYGVEIDADGRIVLGGSSQLSETPNLVARLTRDGRPDPSFDGDGVRLLPRVGEGSGGLDVGVLPDRRVLLAGVATFGGVSDGWFVTRLNADGSDDPSYGTPVVRGRTNAAALGMLVESGGVTLTGQRYEEGRGSHIGVARLTPSGAIAGVALLPAAQESMGRALARGPDGSLAIAGWAGDAESRYAFAVARVGDDGPGSVPAPAPPGTDPALRIPVRSPARVRLRRDRTFTLRLGPFVEQVTGRVEMLLGPRRFARRGFSAARGGTVSVRLRATRRVRRLAARRRGVRVVARLTARDVRARYAARRFAFRLVAR
jgi:uncharacterized delta-60 repeat protein